MVKLNKYAFVGAMLLTGAVGFTACSSDDLAEGPNPNPTFDGESVKTQFAISIPRATGSRLSDAIVQEQGATAFRGLSKIKLIPFKSEPTGSSNFISDAIILSDIASNGGLDNGAKFYENVQIPTGTTHFLFYAEATRAASSDDKTNGAIVAPSDFENGDLLNGGLSTTQDLKFALKPINATATTNTQVFLLSVLNGITSVLYTNMTNDEDLKVAYDNFVKLKAGSGASILAAVQNLYDIVKGGTEPSADYNVAQEILKYFVDSEGVLSYKTDASGYTEDAPSYPTNLGLPAGAAQVETDNATDKVKTFSYNTTDYSAIFGSYAYPASLYYFVSTLAKTDDEAHSTEWSGTYVNDWNTFVDANYQGTSVTSTTRSVVLDDAVNYAVARFDVSPKFKSDRLGEVPDNHNVYREIGNNFQLIGILVGQQNPVDYAFNFMTAEDAEIKTIYDASITATNITETAPSTPFRTLVLQSENGSSDEKKVNFALEFKNNGEDFYGVNGNLIPKGGTFYLVGSLSNYKDGTKSSDYVFQKDYYTTAKVTIASLKDAYNTVPDLRKTELELGLYVDLTWNKGLVGDVVIGE